MLTLMIGLAIAGEPDSGPVEQVLDALHRAAAEADADTYFGLFADDAVFIGTDATERWDLEAFRAFAAPHFEEAPAWVYTPTSREVHLGPKARTAWFYETLHHDRFGDVRGSGALRVDAGRWRVTQYVLSFPIPNDKADDVLGVVQGTGPTLPTPFTASQIRAAYQPGFTALWRHTTPDRTWLEHSAVIAATDDTVTFRGGEVDAAGDPVGEPGEFTARWVELRDHAAFPAGRTLWVDEEEVTVPGGTFVARRYEVTGRDGSLTRFWFALDTPGPPVRMTVTRDGAVVSSMVLESRQVAPPAR